MLYLRFVLQGERYLVECGRVVEILPYAHLKHLPNAPAFIAGILNLRGESVPVVDAGNLISGRPCATRFGTRIVLARFHVAHEVRLLGLLIEGVTEVVRYEDIDFTDPGIHVHDSPYLGNVVVEAQGISQKIDIDQLLPEAEHHIFSSQV